MRTTAPGLLAQALGAIAEAVAAYLLDKRRRLARRGSLGRFGLLLVCLASAFAFGQNSGSPLPQVQTGSLASYPFTIDSTITDIASKVSNKLADLEQNSQLQGVGLMLTAFFLVSMLVWSTLKSMAGGRGLGDLVGEWIPLFVAFGIVTLFLDRTADHLIVATMDSIGEAIAGANMSTLDGAIRAGAVPVFRAIAAVVNQPRATEGASVGSDAGALGFIATLAASGASIVMGAVAKVVTAFVLVLAGVVMVAHIIMGFISVQLVLALAPVMVPFLMFKPMAWLFDSWLRFLLGACLLKIVVAFLLNVVAALLTGMAEHAQNLYQESYRISALETLQVDILMLGMTMVFALLSMLLLMQAPGIAAGLLSGGAGQVGFSGIRGISQSAAGRVVSNAPMGVASGAAAAAGQGWRNFSSWRSARSDALASRPTSLKHRDPQAKGVYAQTYRAYRSTPLPPQRTG
ncbi:MAG: TrbL/VirB6 plasmid conjugal transfer protein [Ramlibacter sp.]|nr:TrbL/VirB6 plasmid conjugal transfer protein [Ramlibacter sp.]